MNQKHEKFIALLLKWFDSNKREFSWRRLELTPFQQLVAELMLQKTGASQVENIFPTFLKRYPDAKSVSKMKEGSLAKILMPLGLFNRRARDLKKTAEIIVENNNKLPKTKKDLMELPGVGDYIANAILCFSFDQPVPIIDANVGRIIKRVFSFPVKSAPSRDKKLAEMMNDVMPKTEFKQFNYAMLDHAALICLPRKPKCMECPLKSICDYHENLNIVEHSEVENN